MPMEVCPFCKSEFKFGPHDYHGRLLQGYGILVCNNCYTSNHDGWHTEDFQAVLLAKLDEDGISHPAKNENGWLPREF